ncbi:MAG: FAD:protein FMN transferase [Ruminiclostridium sp.]
MLGTLVRITISDMPKEQAETLIKESLSLVREIENKLSVNIENSELMYLNNNAYGREIPVSDELFYVLEKSLEYCRMSAGAFDIGIGKLIDLWGIGTENAAVPGSENLAPFINFKGYEHIILNRSAKTVRFDDERVKVNLGACAKGYAEDKTRDFLIENGVKSALLSFGGSVTVIGEGKYGGNYRIAVADPDTADGGHSLIICTHDNSTVTSGDYQRYFVENGVKYHHILDSATGYPADNGIKSITVVTYSAFEGDCLSTAGFVLGRDKAVSLLDSLGCGYVIISDEIIISESLKDFVEQDNNVPG